MNMINNSSLFNSPNFGNAKKQAAEKAVSKLDRALAIAYRNPKTHIINIDNIPDGLGKKAVYITRNCGSNVRTAAYNVNNGELINIAHESFNNINGVVNSSKKGYFTIKDGTNNDGHWFGQKFTSFKDFIAYFRKELPILKKL